MVPADDMKRLAAREALRYLPATGVIGVGSGTTVGIFVDELAAAGLPLDGVVPASEESAQRLADHGIPVRTLGDVRGRLPVCVDGCDEADDMLRLVKGRGGACTREKVLASSAERFVVIAQESKLVRRLGGKPVPVEVLPMAEAHVVLQLERLGGGALRREGFVTDNGGLILDTLGLPLEYPDTLERTLAAIPGVIGTGLFALRAADVGLFGTASGGVRTFLRQR